MLLEELSAGQQSLRRSADESLRKRVWKRFTEGPASPHTSSELLFGGKLRCIGDFGNFREVLQEFKEASGSPKTQPTFTKCVLCGQFPVRLSQAIVLWNPQNTSGLVIAINPPGLNDSPKVTEWVGGLSLQGPNSQFSSLYMHASPGL